jgi:hypothetical protein
MPDYLSQPANGHALRGHVNIRVVAWSPCPVHASKTHRTPLLAPELTARTDLALEKAGADWG